MPKLKVQMNIRIPNDKTMGKKAFFDRQVPRKPRLVGGVEGHNKNEISFPGSSGVPVPS
jgi:hypothetical protein